MTTQEEWEYWEQGRVASDPENYCDGLTPKPPSGFLVNGMSNPSIHAPLDYDNPQTKALSCIIKLAVVGCILGVVVIYLLIK